MNDTVQVVDSRTRGGQDPVTRRGCPAHGVRAARAEVWISARDDNKVAIYDTRTFERVGEIVADSPSGIFFTARAPDGALTMFERLDPVDRRLMDEFQRDLPLVPRPSPPSPARLERTRTSDRPASGTSCPGQGVSRRRDGAAQYGGRFRRWPPSVPEARIEDVAAIVGAEPEVNHSYLREDDWNLWFVATAPDRAALADMLGRIAARTGLRVLDLRLVQPFNIDLGFRLGGTGRDPMPGARRGARSRVAGRGPPDPSGADHRPAACPARSRYRHRDRPQRGRGDRRIAALADAGLLTRVGVIVRHRAVGWTSNAMVVWSLPDDLIEAAGQALAAAQGMSLCYRRQTVPGIWDFPLFNRSHARSRSEALGILGGAAALRTCRRNAPRAFLHPRTSSSRALLQAAAA